MCTHVCVSSLANYTDTFLYLLDTSQLFGPKYPSLYYECPTNPVIKWRGQYYLYSQNVLFCMYLFRHVLQFS